jgi:serine/threonine protein kinase
MDNSNNISIETITDSFKTNKPQLLELIEEGSFGKIYKILWKGNEYAAKIIPREKWGNSLLFECMINKSFTCPYLNMAEKILINKDYIIISELAQSDYPKYKRENNISISLLWKWINQLLIAIYTLHSNNILHGDIKAKNILIMNDNSLKLIDYSCSCFINGIKQKNVYTYTHRAPEIWLDEDWDEKADIWALGCTLFEMISGYLLFPAQKKQNLKERMLNCIDDYFVVMNRNRLFVQDIDHYSPHFSDILEKKEYRIIKDLINDCLIKKQDRLTSKQLLEKYFISFPVNNFLFKFPNYPIIIDFGNLIDLEDGQREIILATEILVSRLHPKEQTRENVLAIISLISKLLNIRTENKINIVEDNICLCLNFQLYFKF